MTILLQCKVISDRRVYKELRRQGFPDGPVVKTPSFHCRRYRFDFMSGNYDFTHRMAQK